MSAAGPRQPPSDLHRRMQYEAAQNAGRRFARESAARRDLRAAREVAETQRQHRLRNRAFREHSSLLRGLLLFALAALTFALLRAGLHRAFVPGWFRQW